MLLKKNRYVRIRVIGGSGIFDSIMNIIKKPIVSKLLTSAGKSIASKLGETLVSKVLPSEQPSIQHSPVSNTPSAKDLLVKYGSSIQSKGSVISIEDYVKKVRGAGIKEV